MTDPQPLSRADFEAQIRDMERYYHIHHPFHV
ncbi:MAG TPA: pyrroloquinoline quinone biosynthesis protein C, partial [Methylococcaceae bacterium]|nr:pyrroloquinoline quinone biosynthesis protein C [Methylococcaceae bacterium]